MRNKSEAPAHVRTFISSFTALVNTRASRPVQIVGTLHSDNAGEFLSREFTDFLSETGVHSSTCPPHVHQLNGVAERAIRSIMELTRLHSSLVAPPWPSGTMPLYKLSMSLTAPRDPQTRTPHRTRCSSANVSES
eukprot:1275323-Pleurochrysis_carterae.AAC.1